MENFQKLSTKITKELQDLGFKKGCIGNSYSYISWPASDKFMYIPGIITNVLIVGKHNNKYKIHSTDGWRINIHGYISKSNIPEFIKRIKNEGNIGITMHEKD